MKQEHISLRKTSFNRYIISLIQTCTAFFTSSPILASSAAVNFFSAKAVGHMAPSSSFASCMKPSVAYLVLNFCALWKKQTTLPSLAYAGIPYQSLGERAGALALMIAWNLSAMARSGPGIAAMFASTALSPSAVSARGPGRAAAFFAACLVVLLPLRISFFILVTSIISWVSAPPGYAFCGILQGPSRLRPTCRQQ